MLLSLKFFCYFLELFACIDILSRWRMLFASGGSMQSKVLLDMKLNTLDLLLTATLIIGHQVLRPFLPLELFLFLQRGQIARRILIICHIIGGQFSHINIAVAFPIWMFLVTRAWLLIELCNLWEKDLVFATIRWDCRRTFTANYITATCPLQQLFLEEIDPCVVSATTASSKDDT